VKTAAASLADLLARTVGLDGAFLLIATISLSVGSWFIATVLPWFVIGLIALLVWLALTLPRRA
jgi:hypothetical protein